MKNFIQPGENLDMVATAIVASGAPVMVGSIFGVAMTSAAIGEKYVLVTKGVFELPKKTGSAHSFAVGAGVYFDAATGEMQEDDTGGAVLIGKAIEAAGISAETVKVKLDQ